MMAYIRHLEAENAQLRQQLAGATAEPEVDLGGGPETPTDTSSGKPQQNSIHDRPLNSTQLRFVELYRERVAAGKQNATQSYRRAGYTCSREAAAAAASRLLADPRVRELLGSGVGAGSPVST